MVESWRVSHVGPCLDVRLGRVGRRGCCTNCWSERARETRRVEERCCSLTGSSDRREIAAWWRWRWRRASLTSSIEIAGLGPRQLHDGVKNGDDMDMDGWTSWRRAGWEKTAALSLRGYMLHSTCCRPSSSSQIGVGAIAASDPRQQSSGCWRVSC